MSTFVDHLVGHYQLTQLLSEGELIQLYQGQDQRQEKTVSVRLFKTPIKEEQEERFEEIARQISELSHPSLVRLLDFGIHEQHPFLVYETPPETNLRTIHPRGERVSVQQIITYTNLLGSVLDYLHTHNIIHGDLRPETILVGWQHNLLLDLPGIASIVREIDPESTYPPLDAIAYQAPEGLQSKIELASDQYSLAVIIYEWLCGETPFQGNIPEIIANHLNQTPTPLSMRVSTLSLAIEQIVMTALAKDPRLRFADILTLTYSLNQATKVQPSSNLPIPHPLTEYDILPAPTPSTSSHSLALVPLPMEEQPTRVSRRRWLLGALGGIAIVTGASTGAYFAYKALAYNQSPEQIGRKLAIKLIYTYTGHGSQKTSVIADNPGWLAWTADGKRVVSQGRTSLRFWNALDGQNEVICTGESNLLLSHFEIEQNKVLPEKMYRLSTSETTNLLTIYDIEQKKDIYVYDGYKDAQANEQPFQMKLSPDSLRTAIADHNGKIRVWQSTNGAQISEFQLQKSEEGTENDSDLIIYSLLWAPNSRYLAGIDHRDYVHIWDTNTGRHLARYTSHKDLYPTIDIILQIRWSPDSQKMLSYIGTLEGNRGMKDSRVAIWDALTGLNLVTFDQLQSSYIADIQWSPDSQYISAMASDHEVHIWEIQSGKEIFINRLRGYEDSLSWHPGSQYIATTMESSMHGAKVSNHFSVWEAKSGKELPIAQTSEDQGLVNVISWSPDGLHLAVAYEGPIEVWQIWEDL